MSIGEELCRPCYQVPRSPAALTYYIKVCHPQKNSAAGMLTTETPCFDFPALRNQIMA